MLILVGKEEFSRLSMRFMSGGPKEHGFDEGEKIGDYVVPEKLIMAGRSTHQIMEGRIVWRTIAANGGKPYVFTIVEDRYEDD